MAAEPSAPWRTAAGEAWDLLTTIARILRHRGLQLAGIAALGLTASFWVQRLAVVVSRTDSLLGLLVFALVPAISFGALAWMLLSIGRPATAPTSGQSRLATFGGALLVYLLLYEQSGQLTAERRSYLWQSVYEAIWSEPGTAVDRVPDVVSVPALVIVAVALVVRTVGSRVVGRLEERPSGNRVLVGGLRLLVGYAEIVWIVLAVVSLLTLRDNVAAWWDQRVVVNAVSHWWAGLGWPDLPAFIGRVGAVVGSLLSTLTQAILVPLVWLVLACLLYGVRFGDVAAVPTYLARLTTSAGGRLRGVGRTVLHRDLVADPERVERSWRRLTQPEGRWDALGGALSLVLARGPLAVVVFCLLFQVLSQVDLVVWELAGLLFDNRSMREWVLVGTLADNLAVLARLLLCAATAAAGADIALRSAGIASPLRAAIAGRPRTKSSTTTTAATEAAAATDASSTAPRPADSTGVSPAAGGTSTGWAGTAAP